MNIASVIGGNGRGSTIFSSSLFLSPTYIYLLKDVALIGDLFGLLSCDFIGLLSPISITIISFLISYFYSD